MRNCQSRKTDFHHRSVPKIPRGIRQVYPLTHSAIFHCDNVLRLLVEVGFSKGAAIISVTTFLALQWIYPNAPTSLKAIN